MTTAGYLSPAQWIEALRQRRGYHAKFRWTENVERLIRSLPRKDRSAARRVWKARVGQPVASILDEQFARDLAGIKPALEQEDLAILEATHVALFPSYDFDAYVGATPFGDAILAIHTGLPHTILTWAHAYTRVLELGGQLTEEVRSEYRELLSSRQHRRQTEL